MIKTTFEHDYDADAPWDQSDCHGPVRRVLHHLGHQKRPGERPLNKPGHNDYLYLYDWKEACRLARVDGWNTDPCDAPNRIQRAVQADFDFLAGWVNDEWSYAIVTVTDKDTGESDSLGGVETLKDHHETLGADMAIELRDRIDNETIERDYRESQNYDGEES